MDADNKWLIKSSDHISGPFEFDNVVESIFSGEYHLLDEIKGPFERWRPIRDHSLFAAAIERLKASTYTPRDQTVTSAIDSSTHTVEMTQADGISKTHEITHTPLVDERTQSSSESTAPSQPKEVSQQPPLPLNQLARKKNRSSGVYLMAIVVLILVGAGYMFMEYQQDQKIDARVSNYDQLTDQAIAALRVGEYEIALKKFSRAYEMTPNDPNLILEMAPLSIQFDGKFSQIEAMVSQLLAANRKVFVKKGKNAIGLTHSYRSNFEQAISFYDASIANDPSFLAPHLNKAFAYIKMQNGQAASEVMRSIVARFPDRAVAHYMYIRSLVEWGVKEKDSKVLQEALSVASQFSERFADFKQEVLFLMAMAHMSLGLEQKELSTVVRTFLSVDPAMTSLHVRDTNMDLQAFHWLGLAKHCSQLVAALDSYSGKLLEGHCLLKIDRAVEAKGMFENLLSQNNKDGVLQALFAASLIKLGDHLQAKNTLGFLGKVEPAQPLVEVNLRGCLSANDPACGQKIFEGPFSNEISLLYSHWGNSQLNFRKDPNRAMRSVQMGLEVSPNFAPLLKLKRNL